MDMGIELMSEEDKEELIRYGIKRGKVIFLSTLITILLGVFIGVIWQSIIFWLSLSILRRYAGGYHADTEKQCYIISFITVMLSILIIKLIKCSGIELIILQTVSSLIILFLAPVENVNHLLDVDERKIYGIRTRIILAVLYFVCISLYFISSFVFLRPIVMANLVVMISLIMGCRKNHKCIKSCG